MRSLARARGFEAKTDGLDAQVLSLFGRIPWQTRNGAKPDPERAELRDLLRRRRQLVNQRVQELNRLDKGITSRTSTKRHIAWLDDEIARLDEEYKKRKAARSCPVGRPFTRVSGHTHSGGGGFAGVTVSASLVGLAPGPVTAAVSGDTGPSGVDAVRCVGPCTWLVGNPKEQLPGALLQPGWHWWRMRKLPVARHSSGEPRGWRITPQPPENP